MKVIYKENKMKFYLITSAQNPELENGHMRFKTEVYHGNLAGWHLSQNQETATYLINAEEISVDEYGHLKKSLG
jgi:hypothetical protein